MGEGGENGRSRCEEQFETVPTLSVYFLFFLFSLLLSRNDLLILLLSLFERLLEEVGV